MHNLSSKLSCIELKQSHNTVRCTRRPSAPISPIKMKRIGRTWPIILSASSIKSSHPTSESNLLSPAKMEGDLFRPQGPWRGGQNIEQGFESNVRTDPRKRVSPEQRIEDRNSHNRAPDHPLLIFACEGDLKRRTNRHLTTVPAPLQNVGAFRLGPPGFQCLRLSIV